MEKGRSKATPSDKEDSVSSEEAGQEVMDTGAAFVAASDEEDAAAEDKGVKMQACSVCLQERYMYRQHRVVLDYSVTCLSSLRYH